MIVLFPFMVTSLGRLAVYLLCRELVSLDKYWSHQTGVGLIRQVFSRDMHWSH